MSGRSIIWSTGPSSISEPALPTGEVQEGAEGGDRATAAAKGRESKRQGWTAPGWSAVLAASLLPGLLLGSLLAQLLFFLNPRLPFGPGPLARGMAFYGLTGILVSLVLILPFTLGRPRRARRLLPWGLTTALSLAAGLTWIFPSYFAFSLPPGINVRLIKAALGLSAAALLAFYTALLHSVYRRSYGVRSRLALLLATLAAVYVLAERRGAFPETPEPVRRPTILETSRRPRLVVIGLESASFDAILPMAEQGLLPFFGKVLEGGSHGHLISLNPSWPGPLWTTVSTGKFAYRHGVVSRRIYPARALGEGRELKLLPPVGPFRTWARLGAKGRFTDARSREVLALWEILAGLGVPTGVVGWPVTSPPPGGMRFALSDRYFSEPGNGDEVVPADLQERARLFRVQSSDPAADLAMPAGLRAPGRVRSALAGDLWRQSLSTFLLDQQPDTGALFLMLPGLRTVTERYFGGYSAVQFEGLQEPASLEAAELVRAYYRRLDGLLAELWERQEGRPCLLVIVSAYGVGPPRGWRRIRAALSERRALEGSFRDSPEGVLLLYGEGIHPEGRLDGARLVDILPTLLYGMGFPIARDLDGQALRQAFSPSFLTHHPLTFVATYEYLREGPPG